MHIEKKRALNRVKASTVKACISRHFLKVRGTKTLVMNLALWIKDSPITFFWYYFSPLLREG